MTLDELEKEFWGDQREQPTRVRLARVVRALREEIIPVRMRITRANDTCSRSSLRRYFNEILGGDAEEAAGASTRKDEEAATHGQSTPAAAPMQRILDDQLKAAKERFPLSTDAAPVCEWTAKGILHGTRFYTAACYGMAHVTYSLTHCPSCKAPISFKDAAP